MEDRATTANVLSEHYRDTCEVVRSRERRRERLLIMISVLLALILLQIHDEEGASRFAQELAHDYIDPDQFHDNLAIIKGAVWGVLVALVQAYYQTDAFIERIYPYIHQLEEELKSITGSMAFRREGAAYETSYPYFLNWSWFFHKWLVPTAIFLVPVIDLLLHVNEHGLSTLGTVFRAIMVSVITVSTVLYLLLVHARK